MSLDLANKFSRVDKIYQNQKKALEKMAIPEENKKLVNEFVESCQLGLFQKKIGMHRATRTYTSLFRLCEMLPDGKIWHDVTKTDIRTILIKIQDRQVGEWEKYSELMALKKFITWLRIDHGYPVDYLNRERLIELLALTGIAPEVKIDIHKPNGLKPIDEIPTEKEIGYLIDACKTYKNKIEGVRDAAIIAILREVGMRIGGLGTLSLKDVQFDDIGALLTIHDKTMIGEPIRIIQAAPYLKSWIDTHPIKGVPDAPLWVNIRGSLNKSMNYQGMRTALKKAIKTHNEYSENKRQITRRIHFHAFRYFAQTRDMINGMPVSIQCRQRGWSPTSKQPMRYARVSTEQVDDWLVNHSMKI